MSVYMSCCYVHPRFETLDGNVVLQLDPAIPGVFNGPYPLGIDPVRAFTLSTAEKNILFILRKELRNLCFLKQPKKFVFDRTYKSWQTQVQKSSTRALLLQHMPCTLHLSPFVTEAQHVFICFPWCVVDILVIYNHLTPNCPLSFNFCIRGKDNIFAFLC